ncbi:hypothetical protein DRQ36_05665 [bacterium]|nr:MAG: hypothetical protein DRQ36_05665 [bacterium]
MLLWAAIIITLIVGLIVGLTWKYPQEFIIGTAYLILLVALGVFYRVLRRIKSRRIEDLTLEIEALQKENEALRAKLGIGALDSIDLDIDSSSLLEKPEEEE